MQFRLDDDLDHGLRDCNGAKEAVASMKVALELGNTSEDTAEGESDSFVSRADTEHGSFRAQQRRAQQLPVLFAASLSSYQSSRESSDEDTAPTEMSY